MSKRQAPDAKPATNSNKAGDDLDRGLELLLAILIASGYPSTIFLSLLTQVEKNRIIDRLIADASAKLIALTKLLMQGRIAFRVWLIQMRDVIVQSHAAGTLVLAGKEELSDPEEESWISEVNLQYGYLVNWYNELREGRQHFNQSMPARADLYARAIWAVAWRVWVADKLHSRLSEQKTPYGLRVLGVAEHCTGEQDGRKGCIELASLDWQPLEDVVPIGSARCLSRCRCSIIVEWR